MFARVSTHAGMHLRYRSLCIKESEQVSATAGAEQGAGPSRDAGADGDFADFVTDDAFGDAGGGGADFPAVTEGLSALSVAFVAICALTHCFLFAVND